jgi:hypothetical protein
MTTLAANKPGIFSAGNIGAMGIIASDIIYEGAMVGDNGSGYARPLTAGDRFLGHCIEKCDNSSGSAGAKNVQYYTGRYRLRVTFTIAITDVGQPVYASDDDVLTLVAPSNSYVGVVTRYISSTEAEVEFRPGEVDEFGTNVSRVTKSADYTTDAADNGKIIYVDTDTKIVTLLAVAAGAFAGYQVTVVNSAAAGAALVEVDYNNSDLMAGGCGLAATGDGVKTSNTKATAKRGDYITLVSNGGTGYNLVARRGTWA